MTNSVYFQSPLDFVGDNRVLIAEDHNVSRYMLAHKLAHWGFSVVTANDGDEALSILESEDAPPLAILDWMMPKMDGLDVCVRVRGNKSIPYIYLMLLTVKTHKDEILKASDAGADDYVMKPFNADEFQVRLKIGLRVVKLERTIAQRSKEMESAIADARQLKGLLPICRYCKSVRNDEDYRHVIDEYIEQDIGTDLSQGICPSCRAKLEIGECDG